MALLRKAKKDRQQIGDYDLLEKIGAGGMGTVYKGRHRITGIQVAVKTASAEVAEDPVLRQRFQQEYTAVRAIEHPHIVRALDFHEEGAVPYLVMELVDGPSLGDRIAKGRLPEAEAVRIGVQVAQGLHRAHQEGLIHRDVKPDNILLTAGGVAKLADLGLAKDLDADLRLTQTASVLGTPNFMAPEQFADARGVDCRCDVYSLGATLYMAVTGQLPFQARGVGGVLRKKLAEDILPPRQLVRQLSERVDRTIMRSIRVDRQARPASCLELIEELTGKPVEASFGREKEPAAARPGQSDRRATVRYPSRLESSCRPIREGKKSCWEAKVRDVSAQGVGLLVNRRFEPGTLLVVELGETRQSLIRLLLARVVRVEAASARRWVIGCELCRELSSDDVQSLLG